MGSNRPFLKSRNPPATTENDRPEIRTAIGAAPKANAPCRYPLSRPTAQSEQVAGPNASDSLPLVTQSIASCDDPGRIRPAHPSDHRQGSSVKNNRHLHEPKIMPVTGRTQARAYPGNPHDPTGWSCRTCFCQGLGVQKSPGRCVSIPLVAVE